jgi:hypothetical protein
MQIELDRANEKRNRRAAEGAGPVTLSRDVGAIKLVRLCLPQASGSRSTSHPTVDYR